MTDINELISLENVKLIKNSRGYSWEIKVNGLDIDKLEQLNNEMNKRFGFVQHEETE